MLPFSISKSVKMNQKEEKIKKKGSDSSVRNTERKPGSAEAAETST